MEAIDPIGPGISIFGIVVALFGAPLIANFPALVLATGLGLTPPPLPPSHPELRAVIRSLT